MKNYLDFRFRVTRDEVWGAQEDEFDVCTLTPSEVVSYEAVAETDLGAGYTPCGSLVLSITEDAADPIIGVASSERVKLYYEVKDGGSWVWVGSYYVDKITRDVEVHEVTITAYDYLYFLGMIEFKGANFTRHSFSDWVYLEDMLKSIPGFMAFAPTTVSFPDGDGSVTTDGFVPRTTCREALRLVAEASATAMYVGRASVLGIPQNEVVIFGNPVKTDDPIYISPDYIVENTHTAVLEKDKTAIEVNYTDYGDPGTLQEVVREQGVVVPAGEKKAFSFDLAIFPVTNVTIYTSLSSADQQSKVAHHLFGDRIDVSIDNRSGGTDLTTFVTILAKPLSEDKRTYLIGNSTDQEKQVIDNSLIGFGAAGANSIALRVALLHDMYDLGANRHRFEICGTDLDLLDDVEIDGVGGDIVICRKAVTVSADNVSVVVDGIEYANARTRKSSEGGRTE